MSNARFHISVFDMLAKYHLTYMFVFFSFFFFIAIIVQILAPLYYLFVARVKKLRFFDSMPRTYLHVQYLYDILTFYSYFSSFFAQHVFHIFLFPRDRGAIFPFARACSFFLGYIFFYNCRNFFRSTKVRGKGGWGKSLVAVTRFSDRFREGTTFYHLV